MLSKIDFAHLRDRMVDEQLIPRGISDPKVLAVFRKVPRHEFIGESELSGAYGDYPLPIGSGQTISQPYMVAIMTELLKLKETDKALEVGTGSGYQAAVLAELAKEVYSVERYSVLASNAEATLKRLGYANIHIKAGDGTVGWKEYAPYDAIIVTAGAPRIPDSLIEQLNEGGRLVIPVGEYYTQTLILADKYKGKIKTKPVCGCVFVPLIGKEGWKEDI